MGLSSLLSNTIDSAVSIVSPRAGIQRIADRKFLADLNRNGGRKNGRQRGETYAAAKSSRLTGVWSPANTNVNEIIRASNPIIRARVRQLIRDFPIFTRAVNVTLDHVIGSGLAFQSRVKKDGGDLNDPLITKIEDSFKYWNDEADITGHEDFYGLMRLAKRQELESGAFILVKRQIRDRSRYLPYCLQSIEPDMLSDYPGTTVAKGNEIEQGIEYVKDTGKPVRFHFTDPDGWGKTISVSASDVIHGFDMLRAGQKHGVSPFVSGVLLAKDLVDYIDSEIDTAKMASKYLAFVKRNPATRSTTLDDGEGDDEGKKIDELENAIIEYLNPGEEIELAQNNRPGTNFPPTVKLILCLFSAATGVPYELLSFDYKGINYSSTRVIRNDFIQSLKPITNRFVRQFCKPGAIGFFDSAYLNGKIQLPNYMSNPMPYFAWEWQPPGVEMIDWLKESKARVNEMGVSLRSPQEIVKARGRDWEEVIKETAAAVKALKEAELDFLIPLIWQSPSLSVANNPAAVETQGGKNNGNGSRGFVDEVMDALGEIQDGLDQIQIQ